MVDCSGGFAATQATPETGSKISAQSLLLTIIEKFEYQGIPYAVWTPCTGEPPSVSSDVDLTLSADPRATIESILLELQEQGDLQILQRLHTEVPAGYCYILRPCRAQDNRLLHLDCLFDPDGIGHLGIPTSPVVAGRIKEWWGYRANDRDLAIYYLIKRALKAAAWQDSLTPVKLAELQEILQRAGRDEVEQGARKLLGEEVGDLLGNLFAATTIEAAGAALSRIERVWGKRRWRTHPLRILQRGVREFLRLARRALQPYGLFVVLLGPDGCGKSTLADALGNQLSGIYEPPWRFHWRPGLLPKLSRRETPSTSSPIVEPPREAAYGTFISFARYLYYLTDFILGYWVLVYPKKVVRTLVIGERWYFDVIVNPQRYGFSLPRWLLRLGQRLVPRPDLVLLLAAAPEVVHARKPELATAEIQAQIDQFRAILSNEPGVVEVNAGREIPEVIRQVREAILQEPFRLTAKRLGSKPEWQGFGRRSDPKVWRHQDDRVGHALKLYNPTSVPGRFAKFVASLAPLSICARLFFRASPSPAQAAELAQHARVIRQVLNNPASTVSFATGTPGPHRKMTAQVTAGKAVQAYVKIGDGATLAELFDTEVRALSSLVSTSEAGFKCPKIIADVRKAGYRYLFLTPAAEGARPRTLKPDRLDERFLSHWPGLESPQISVEEILAQVPAVSGLGKSEEQILADASNFVREAFQERGVRTWPSHGDYAPWNTLLLRDGNLYVFDWEYFDEKGPALRDVFHRIFMAAMLVEGLSPAQLVGRLTAVRGDKVFGPVVERSGLSAAEIPAYLMIYLLGLMRRRGYRDTSFRSFLVECLRLILLQSGCKGYRRRVLVSAYACEPGKGSEPGVGWNWVQAISKHAEVWTITKGNNRTAIQQELGGESGEGLHFEYVELPKWLSFWKKGPRGIKLYYYLWQFAALARARKLLRSQAFDLAHHVTFVNDRVWTFLALLPLPFIWGPIGSNIGIPQQLFEDRRVWLLDAGKRSFQWAFRLVDPLYWLSILRATKVLCINETVARTFPLRLVASKIKIEPAIAVEDLPPPVPAGERRGLRVLFAGNFIAIKGPGLALEAFSHFASVDLGARLTMVGDGPLSRRLHQQAIDLGIADKVNFVPWLPRAAFLRSLGAHDVFLFPSMEGGGMVVLEAMASGLPVVCLDFGGPGQMVTPEVGIKVAVGPRSDVVLALAESLGRIAQDGTWLEIARRERIRETTQSHFSWNAKVRLIPELYHDVT